MNATKYLNSRLGKTIEQIKKAYLSGRHICFLVCSEPEFIKDLLCSESFFPNLKLIKSNPNTDSSIKFMGENDSISSNVIANLNSPQLFIWTGNDNGVHIPIEDLTNYVNITTTLSKCNKVVNADDNEKLLLLRQSLILVVVRSKPKVPTYIEPYSAIVTVPLMNETEFKDLVSGYLEETESITTTTDTNGYKRVANDDYLTKLYQNMMGLNATQVINILKKNQIALGSIYYDEKDRVYKDKLDVLINNIKHEFKQLIDTSRALSLVDTSDNDNKKPVGLDNMIEWIDKIKDLVSNPNDFRSYLLESPKGLIVSGVPGSGKSMMARYIAHIMKLSLVKFDLGNVGGQYVGDSERNMDEALDLIDSISPCILWIDEIEKAFTINNSSHETTLKVFGKFLTWIQEKSSCFIFATSNDISKMPPELFRSGRFDGKFFTFMPTADECAQIFDSTIRRQVGEYQSNNTSGDSQPKPLFNLEIINGAWFKDFINDNCILGFPKGIEDTSVNKLNKFFIGADIVQLIKMAKIEYLHNKKDKRCDEDKEDAIFDSNKFKESLKTALKALKTYGETDLEKIAKCYAQLAVNNFSSASKGMILPFEGYDDLDYKADSKNNNRLYDLNRGKGCNDAQTVHFNKLECNYDKCLYIIVRNTINKIAVEIINNVKRI